MTAAAIKPPLIINEGLIPKKAGFHSTRSAILPTSTEPTSRAIPWAIAGLIVYLAIYLRARRLSMRSLSCFSGPRCSFILCAVCQVRVITSPTRPMAWESEAIMLNPPKSWKISSAAMVSLRIRESAKATSSGIPASR